MSILSFGFIYNKNIKDKASLFDHIKLIMCVVFTSILRLLLLTLLHHRRISSLLLLLSIWKFIYLTDIISDFYISLCLLSWVYFSNLLASEDWFIYLIYVYIIISNYSTSLQALNTSIFTSLIITTSSYIQLQYLFYYYIIKPKLHKY